MTSDRSNKPESEQPENGVLDDSGDIDTTDLGLLGTNTVNITLPTLSDDGEDDVIDDAADISLLFDALLTGESVPTTVVEDDDEILEAEVLPHGSGPGNTEDLTAAIIDIEPVAASVASAQLAEREAVGDDAEAVVDAETDAEIEVEADAEIEVEAAAEATVDEVEADGTATVDEVEVEATVDAVEITEPEADGAPEIEISEPVASDVEEEPNDPAAVAEEVPADAEEVDDVVAEEVVPAPARGKRKAAAKVAAARTATKNAKAKRAATAAIPVADAVAPVDAVNVEPAAEVDLEPAEAAQETQDVAADVASDVAEASDAVVEAEAEAEVDAEVESEVDAEPVGEPDEAEDELEPVVEHLEAVEQEDAAELTEVDEDAEAAVDPEVEDEPEPETDPELDEEVEADVELEADSEPKAEPEPSVALEEEAAPGTEPDFTTADGDYLEDDSVFDVFAPEPDDLVDTAAAVPDTSLTPTEEPPVAETNESARRDITEPARAVQPVTELKSKRLGDLQDAATGETPDLLTADRLLDPNQLVKPEPEGAWRHLVYSMSGKRINLGDSKRARERKALSARIAAPLAGGSRFVPVLSRKGGVGKTTATMLLGMALADARDDRIVAVDANPDRGTLAERIGRSTQKTVRDLVRVRDEIRGFNDLSSLVARDETRLDVLASDSDPRVAEAFSDADYRAVAEVASRYYSIVLTDCGTGIVHSVMGATLDLADRIVIVAGLSVDEARLASETLTWLDTNGYGDLARDAIVVLNQTSSGAPVVRLNELETHFRSRVRDVVRLPYDPMIASGSSITFRDLQPETRLAARELAALVVAGLRESASA